MDTIYITVYKYNTLNNNNLGDENKDPAYTYLFVLFFAFADLFPVSITILQQTKTEQRDYSIIYKI